MLLQLIVAAILPVVPCPDELPIHAPPLLIDILGCDSAPCHVNQGDSITYEVNFTAAVTTNEMRLAVNATLFGVQNPVQLSPELADACNTIVGNCPVTQGQILTQRATIPVITDVSGGIPAELKFYISHAPYFYCTCAVVSIVIH